MTDKEDEVLLDLGKIKGFFKKSKKTHTEEQTDNAGQDHSGPSKTGYQQASRILQRYGLILLILIPLFCAIYFRAYPVYLPVTDNWASSNVNNYYRNQIASQINSQYPHLPETNKNALIDAELEKFREGNKGLIEQQVKQVSQNFKQQFQDDTGQTYLLAIDPYFYLRNVENVLDHGYEMDVQENGCYYDSHAGAPLIVDDNVKCKGQKSITSFHVFFETWFYRIWHFFNRNVTTLKAAFYVPLIIAMLSVIPAFFLARRVGGNLGGFFAAMIVAVHTSFLTRTPAGFADTDAYNVTLPLFIMWMFIESLYANKTRTKIIYSLGSGFLTGLYAWSWGGWWYIFDFMMVSILGYVGYYVIVAFKERKRGFGEIWKNNLKPILSSAVSFVVFAGIFISLFTTFSAFIEAPLQPVKFSAIKDVATVTLWPNVFTTVAELNPASLPQIINSGGMGKPLLFALGLVGLILSLPKAGRALSKKEKKFMGASIAWYAILIFMHNSITSVTTFVILLLLPIVVGALLPLIFKDVEFDIKYATMLAVWLGGTVYASTKGVRFLLILVPAISIAIGIAVGVIYRHVSNWVSKEFHINKVITKSVIALLFLLLLITPLKSANSVGLNEIPSFNDAWKTSLLKIKDNSSEDAIVNSWWDFGHWFKYWTDRGVTLDGGIQNRPQAHWLGRLMQTSDERESMGILNMLACGGDHAFNKLNGYNDDDFLGSITLLKAMILVDRTEAARMLKDNGFSKDETVEVLRFTHCNPPEDFFITSQDMVGKSGVWAHFGSWNFTRAGMYNRVKDVTLDEGVKILKDDFDLDETDAENIYYEVQTQDANNWVSPWPTYVSGINGCSVKDNQTLICPQILHGGQQIVIEIDMETMDAKIPAQGDPKPASLVYVTDNGTVEKFFEGNTIQFSAILIPNVGSPGFSTILVHPLLANSIFTRMFYLEGHGLDYFDKFDDRRDVTGQRIITWKVNWDGEAVNQVYIRMSETTDSESKDAVPETEEKTTGDAENKSTETTNSSTDKTEPEDTNATNNS